MATFNQLTTLLAEQLGRELDYSFKEMLKVRIKAWRARLISNALERSPQERQFYVQSLVVPLTAGKSTDCGLPLDCPVMVSASLPKAIIANNIMFDFVGSIDGFTEFKKISDYELRFKRTDKHSNLVTKYYTVKNWKIVLPNDTLTPSIRVDMIPNDPEEAIKLQCGDDETCNFDEQEFTLEGKLEQLIIQSILQVDFNRRLPDLNNPEVNVNETGK